jgi:ferredoxin
MANKVEKWEENVPGKYFIDQNCDNCALCVTEAPNNIRESEDGDHSYVFKQPENEEEEKAMREAIDSCPTEAIGDDGV